MHGLGYSQNHMVSTYCVINIFSKHIVISHDTVCINKTCGKYVSRPQHKKAGDSFLLKK